MGYGLEQEMARLEAEWRRHDQEKAARKARKPSKVDEALSALREAVYNGPTDQDWKQK